MVQKFPSLDIKHTPPYCWLQWKGSDVCADFNCNCGYSGHLDTYSMYHIQCPQCKQIYECDGHITLHKIDFIPDFVKIPDIDSL